MYPNRKYFQDFQTAGHFLFDTSKPVSPFVTKYNK